jgi:WD40 repeat protein
MRALVLLVCLCGSVCAADPPKKDAFGDALPEGALLRLGTTRGRAPIYSFGIQKDGTVVSVTDTDEGVAVRLWDTDAHSATAPLLFPLADKSYRGAAQVSADGKYVAGVAKDKLAVWEEATAKRVALFEIERVSRFAFAPSGTLLAATNETDRDNTATEIYFCDVKTGKARKAETDAGRYAEALAFSGDGKRFAVVSDSSLIVWDTATGKELTKNRTGRLRGRFALNRAGDLLVGDCGGSATTLLFVDPQTGKVRDDLKPPPKGRWAAFTDDDKALLVGEAGRAVLWDYREGNALRAFPGAAASWDSSYAGDVRFAPDGKTLVGSNGSVLLRWSAETGKPLFAEQSAGHAQYANGIGASPDGKLIAARGMDSTVIVWDAHTGKERWRADSRWSNAPHLDFSPDSKLVYTIGPKRNEVTQRDAATGKAVRTFAAPRPEGATRDPWITRARLSPDGKALFAVASGDTPGKCVRLGWDTATGKMTSEQRYEHEGVLDENEISPDGRFFAPAMLGAGAFTFGAPKVDLLAKAERTVYPMFCTAFSDDGKWLVQAGASGDENAREYGATVISTANWKVVCRVPAEKPGRAAVSPDGKTLAVAVEEDVSFYDVATEKKIGAIRAPDGAWAGNGFRGVRALRFTADGTKLITAHADTTALVWPVPARAK